jgi:hypothetical protein
VNKKKVGGKVGKFNIGFRPERLTGHAVTVLLHDFAQRLGVEQLLEEELSVKTRERGYGEGGADTEHCLAEVLTSPYCRCIDTAKLAFGKFTIVADLVWTLGQPEAETRRLAEALRKLLGTQPSKGTNTVLVSHTANLKEAVGVWPEPEGAMYIFQPREDGGVSYLGNIGPEEWTALTPTAE